VHQPADAEEADQDRHHQVDEAGAEGAEHGPGHAGNRRSGDDRCDEGEGRAQVGGYPATGDDNVEQGAKTTGDQGNGGAEPGQDRHQDGGAEHGE
jgi:hypothetical protein